MTIVIPQYENWEDIDTTLTKSNAEILIISPNSNVTSTSTRMDLLNENIGELQYHRYGDLFKSTKYPNLKLVIQISHKTIPGTEKFKVNSEFKYLALFKLY